MTPVPMFTIKLAKPGVELVLNALAQMPYATSAGLIREIEEQANAQLKQMQQAAEAAAEPVPETANTGE